MVLEKDRRFTLRDGNTTLVTFFPSNFSKIFLSIARRNIAAVSVSAQEHFGLTPAVLKALSHTTQVLNLKSESNIQRYLAPKWRRTLRCLVHKVFLTHPYATIFAPR